MLDQVVGGEQHPALARPRRPCRSGCARAGAGPRSVRSRSSSALAVAQRPRDLGARRPRRGTRATPSAARATRPRGCRGAASAPSANSSSRSARSRSCSTQRASRSSAATSAPERRARIVDQPEVVDVLVGDDDQLEVLDRVAALGELALELVQRLARVGPGVDQRQRVVLDQVVLTRPTANGVGIAGGGCRPRSALERLLAPSSLTSGSAPAPRRAARSMSSRRDQRLEVQAQQRLGVRRAHVEVPVVVVDRDAVEPADSPSE